MKIVLLLFVLITKLSVSQNGGLHLQWHQSANGTFHKNVNDTVYVPVKVANTSTFNAIAVINLNSEKWSYLPNISPYSFSISVNPKIIMKNSNEGICTLGGNPAHKTTDKWQTSTVITSSATVLESNSYGYIGYTNNSGTYTAVFSPDAANWNNLYTTTLVPQFSQTKTKVYTCDNGILKVSTNGGSSFSTLNPTVAVTGSKVYSPNNDTLFLQTTQWMRSFDGGISWSGVPLPSTFVTQIACKNGKEIMMMETTTLPKKIHYSNNSGASWTTYTTINTFYSGEILTATKSGFHLFPGYKSEDGDSWKSFLASSPAPKPYDLSHTGNIVLAGYAQGYFGYSKNGGHNFTFLPNKISTNDIMSVKAVDINKFIASDRKGQIYVSTNQGASWSQKTTSTINSIPRKIVVSNDKSVIVVTSIGSAYMSGDGGTTFAYLNTTIGNGHFQSIKPTSNKIVDVAPLFAPPTFTHSGYEFYDISSSNVRTLTSTLTITVAQDIVDVHMINDNVGYLLTRNPSNNETIIYKTTDGWVSTNTISVISTPSVGIRSYDAKYGILQNFGTDTLILSGSGSPINNQTNYYHISYDQGVTWNLVSTNFSFPINTLGDKVYKMLFFTPNQYMSLVSNTGCGSIAASGGVFINTLGGGGSISIGINEYLSGFENTSFKVYPNPAKDVLNLEVSNLKLQQNSISVSIMNGMGQLVYADKLDFNENHTLNISSLPQGLYFISLIQNDVKVPSKFIKH